MTKLDRYLLDTIKLVYGTLKVNLNSKVGFGDKVIHAWSIVGYDTLKELEERYSDEDILHMWKSIRENARV